MCGDALYHGNQPFTFCVFLDNVHFQQAAEISEALVDEQVDFEAMVSDLEKSKRSHWKLITHPYGKDWESLRRAENPHLVKKKTLFLSVVHG